MWLDRCLCNRHCNVYVICIIQALNDETAGAAVRADLRSRNVRSRLCAIPHGMFLRRQHPFFPLFNNALDNNHPDFPTLAFGPKAQRIRVSLQRLGLLLQLGQRQRTIIIRCVPAACCDGNNCSFCWWRRIFRRSGCRRRNRRRR